MSETFFLSFRSDEFRPGTVIADPHAYSFDPATPNQLQPWTSIEADVRGRNLLFVVHGFNVGGASGRFSASHMEADLRSDPNTADLLGIADVVIGVLWPGDWYVKVVNYSWEYADADLSGQHLAAFIERRCAGAASISMVSHSLGARVVLTAAARLRRAGEDKALRELCVTAGAVDDDCLNRQFAAAVDNSEHVTVLASRRDVTLAAAYPAGDLLSDAMGDNDNPFEGALGRYGPKRPVPANVWSFTIPPKPHNPLLGQPQPLSDFDHTDYFPKHPRPAQPRKSDAVSRFIAGTFHGKRPPWR